MANRPKVTQPVTDNAERSRRQNKQDLGKKPGSPSRTAETKTGGGHEKKPGKAPKKGG